jgi:hypothetical protein
LTLLAGRPHALEVELPGTLPRPYWVRCFAEPAGIVAVVDPPITELKVA